MPSIETLYTLARDFLLEQNGVDAAVLDLHCAVPAPGERPSDMRGLTKALLSSAQNAQMSPNVVGKALSGIKGDISPLGRVLFDFDPRAIHERFSGWGAERLFDVIRPILLRIPEKTGIWMRYCKTVLSAADYLRGFAGAGDFYALADSYEKDDVRRYEFPSVIADRVEGIGYALACDFMLGLGYASFGKPDVHVKAIFADLGFLDPKKLATRTADIRSLELLAAAARSAGVTVYAVDKLLWLIGSGDFYLALPRFAIGRKRDEFRIWVEAREPRGK